MRAHPAQLIILKTVKQTTTVCFDLLDTVLIKHRLFTNKGIALLIKEKVT